MRNTSVPPPSPKRSRFTNAWAEAEYLEDKIVYWFCKKNRPSKGRLFAERLNRLLHQMQDHDGSVLLEGYRALVHEVLDQYDLALAHRTREAKLVQRVLNDLGPVGPIDYEYLAETKIQKAALEAELGKTAQARKTLEDAKKLARRHGFRFTGQSLLRSLSSATAGNGTQEKL